MKIIIVGKSGSGKDYFKQYLISRGLRPDISCTTRPKREHETDHIDYNFMEDNDFMYFVEKKEMIQWQEFNGFKYGTIINSWNNADVFIMNVSGLKQLDPELRKQALVYYLNIDSTTRFKRIIKRDYDIDEYNEDTPNYSEIGDTINKRLVSDADEYKDFTGYDIEITNPNFLNIKP